MSKNPGEIERKRARKSSRPFCRAAPSIAKVRLMFSPWASRQGTLKPDGHSLHPRQGAYPALHLTIKITHLLRRSPIRHHRQIHSQHAGGVERRPRVLEYKQGLHQRTGSGEQQERGRDLRHGEDAQPPVTAASRDPQSAAGQAEAVRRDPRRAAAEYTPERQRRPRRVQSQSTPG